MMCFGTLGVGDRVRAAVLLGCDVFGGVSGVTPRVINDNHRNLSVFIATYDEELKWSLAVAIDALLYMPVHDSAGAKVYSIGAPKRLSAMLRQFAIGTIAIDPIDTAVHTECDCGRIFDQYLCCNAWTECAECMLWLCSVCITVHDCTTPRDAWSATRLVKLTSSSTTLYTKNGQRCCDRRHATSRPSSWSRPPSTSNSSITPHLTYFATIFDSMYVVVFVLCSF